MGAEQAIAAAADDHRIRAVVAEDAGTSTFADATSVFARPRKPSCRQLSG
jgi:hypothetical protein